MPESHERATKRFRHWVWPLVANLYLLSPVLFHELGLRSGQKVDKIALFALPASVLWLALLHTFIRRMDRIHAWLLPLYLLVGIDLFLVFHYQTRLTSSTMTVILENWGNAGDYARTNPIAIIATTVLALGFWQLCTRKLRGVVLPAPGRARWLIAVGLIGLYSAISLRQARALGGSLAAGVLDVVSHDRNSPLGVVPQGYVAYSIYQDVREHQRAAESFRFRAKRLSPVPGPELYVLIVGESSRPDHWGLYGYSRNTTPGLARQSNLIAFRDVVTQAALTQLAVPLMLTRGDIDQWEKYQAERSIVSAFKEVGFKTYWFSTQQRDQYTGPINRYSAEADHVRYFDRQHDGILVQALQETASATDRAEKLFFVLHTQGSHGVYEDRYPKPFEIFPVNAAGLSERARLVNAYDNTIVYTDHVLTRLLEFLQRTPGLNALVYMADHGENLRDDARGLLGHFFNNRYDLPVPFLFWYSAEFESQRRDQVAFVRLNQTHRISSRSVFHTLAQMGNIELNDARTASLSVLSPTFAPPPRRVLHKWDSVDKKESVDFDTAIRPAPSAPSAPLTERE